MEKDKNIKDTSTRMAVETAIDISRIHEGTWEGNARKYIKNIATYAEIIGKDYQGNF